MSPLAAHRGLKLVQALGGAGILRPLRKELRTEKDFVKFEAAFSPKPLFFRKAKSSTTAPPGTPAAKQNTVQRQEGDLRVEQEHDGRVQEDRQEPLGQSHGPLPRGLQPRAEAAARGAEDAHQLAGRRAPGDQAAADSHAKEKAHGDGLLLG